MAIYHLAAKIISRGKGQSAVAAAAYRAGVALRDERDGELKDFTKRDHGVVFSRLLLPANAPDWAFNREQLWNRVEAVEKRKDAQLAREIVVALPHELTDQQREWLVKDFVRENFVRRGLAADVAIHAPSREGDERNHHAHILFTTRTLGPEGFSPHKDRSLNSRAQLETWREKWADLANRHLERHGHESRIDHRSNDDRGIEAEPTQHEGPAVTNLARRKSEITERRQDNADIRMRNAVEVSQPHEIEKQEPRPLSLRERAELAFQQKQEQMRKEFEEKPRRRADGIDRPAGDVSTDRAGMVAQQRENLSRTTTAADRLAEKLQAARVYREQQEEERHRTARPYRKIPDVWTDRAGMVAQEDEALSRTAAGKERQVERTEARKEQWAHKVEEARAEKAAEYFREHIAPRRIERPSEERAPAPVHSQYVAPSPPLARSSPDPVRENTPQDPARGSPQHRPRPEPASEQRRRQEAPAAAPSPQPAAQRGPEPEKTDAKAARESKTSGREMTERERELQRFLSGRQEQRSRDRDQDGGRER